MSLMAGEREEKRRENIISSTLLYSLLFFKEGFL